MKKEFTKWGFILTLMLLVATVMLACQGGSVSFTTAKISEATMTTAVNENMQPLDNNDVFSPDTAEIFCSFKLSNAPDDTEVKAEWIYLQGELQDVTDYLVDEWVTTTDGTRYVSSSLTSPDEGWPRGDYQVIIYIDGKEQTRLPFYVQ